MRFVGLDASPPGFWIDESAHAMNAICLEQTGHDAQGVRLPLFSSAIQEFTPPTLLYSEAAWSRVFGHSIRSLRSLAATVNVLTIAGLFLIGALLFDERAGLFMALAGAISPWSFQFSRIAWDPPLAPCFLVLGVYFFLRAETRLTAGLAALGFSLASYAYGPARLQVPLVLALLIILKRRVSRLSWSWLGILALVMAIVMVPLIRGELTGALMGRFNTMSVFHATTSVGSALALFASNVLSHFSVNFLVLHGDTNLRHSTGFGGQMDWLDVLTVGTGLALFVAAVVRRRPWGLGRFEAVLVFLMLGYLAGVAPAAMTTDGIPHALRSIGCWPFLAMIVGLILWRLDRLFQPAVYAALAVAALFFVAYTQDYFVNYPSRSSTAFQAAAKDYAEATQRRGGDWQQFKALFAPDVALNGRYYAVEYGGETCESSR